MSTMTSTTSIKGQVVIPADLRRKFGIKRGTKVNFREEGGRIVLRPVTRDYIRKVRGMLKGSGVLQELMAERRREREE
ncbi:MAG TPA: AbrB/MazE/SpoVT family DNA-binding domain-containing protein [Planctomycetota bacterium]|nr:AbrB/MazE/SpoVT family DNA-binding domain-containing protein [Planctomycetota bacterium]